MSNFKYNTYTCFGYTYTAGKQIVIIREDSIGTAPFYDRDGNIWCTITVSLDLDTDENYILSTVSAVPENCNDGFVDVDKDITITKNSWSVRQNFTLEEMEVDIVKSSMDSLDASGAY